jgi:hypothetical protein
MQFNLIDLFWFTSTYSGPFVTKSKTLNKRCVNKASLLKKTDTETGHEYAFDNPYFKDDDMETHINGAIKSAKNMMYQGKPLY